MIIRMGFYFLKYSMRYCILNLLEGIQCILVRTVHKPRVKYGVRSPKFNWAPCTQLFSLAEASQLPPPPAFGLIGRYRSAKIDDISL